MVSRTYPRLRRGERPAHGLGHAARQRPAAGWYLSDVPFYGTELPQYALLERLIGLHSNTAHVAAAMTYTLVVPVGRPARQGRNPAGGLAADPADRRHHVRAPTRGRGLHPAPVRGPHWHRRPAHAHLAGYRFRCQGRSGQAAPVGPRLGGGAADLGAGRRPAGARDRDRAPRGGVRRPYHRRRRRRPSQRPRVARADRGEPAGATVRGIPGCRRDPGLRRGLAD